MAGPTNSTERIEVQWGPPEVRLCHKVVYAIVVAQVVGAIIAVVVGVVAVAEYLVG